MDPKDHDAHHDLPHPHPTLSPASVDLDHGSPSPSLNAVCGPGFPGVLSLHHYRRYLSDSPPADSDEMKKLRRKNAAFNLNQYQAHMSQPHQSPFAASSVASSPPPLSPSHSPSAWSEQGPESLEGFCLRGSPSPLDVTAEQIYYVHPSPSKHDAHRILDTFRERLEKHPDTALSQDTTHALLKEDPTVPDDDHPLPEEKEEDEPPSTNPTIVHHGTAFEILNPRASLRFARIVSYIEDVQNPPDAVDSDASLRTQSIAEEDETPHPPEHAYHDLVGDSPHHPMPSISERLEERDDDDGAGLMPAPLAPRPQSPVSSLGSEIGEPGSPVSEQHEHGHAHAHGHGYDQANAWDQPPPYRAYGYGYEYDGLGYGNQSGVLGPALLAGVSGSTMNTLTSPDVVQIHRKLSRRAVADRRKGQNGHGGAFRRLCARLRRRRSS
ncbi:hypothetical protein HFD88_001115 [Aspergillus terreus]|nr:hypothetical protein HFD88_001115 [Aspergillus terreus]